jgi:hypothetical protein
MQVKVMFAAVNDNFSLSRSRVQEEDAMSRKRYALE